MLASAGEDLPLVAPVRYTLATVAARILAVDTELELVAVAHKPVVDIALVVHTQLVAVARTVEHRQLAVDTVVPAQHTLVADIAVALRTPVDIAEHNKVGNTHSYSLHMLHPPQSRGKVRPDHDNQHKSGCCNTVAV